MPKKQIIIENKTISIQKFKSNVMIPTMITTIIKTKIITPITIMRLKIATIKTTTIIESIFERKTIDEQVTVINATNIYSEVNIKLLLCRLPSMVIRMILDEYVGIIYKKFDIHQLNMMLWHSLCSKCNQIIPFHSLRIKSNNNPPFDLTNIWMIFPTEFTESTICKTCVTKLSMDTNSLNILRHCGILNKSDICFLNDVYTTKQTALNLIDWFNKELLGITSNRINQSTFMDLTISYKEYELKLGKRLYSVQYKHLPSNRKLIYNTDYFEKDIPPGTWIIDS